MWINGIPHEKLYIITLKLTKIIFNNGEDRF